jgi:WD40 repeat protein
VEEVARGRALLVAGNFDRTVNVWALPLHGGIDTEHLVSYASKSCCSIVSTRDAVFIGAFDGTVVEHTLLTGDIRHTYRGGHTNAVTALDVNPSLGLLVTGSADVTVRVFVLATGELLRVWDEGAAHLGPVRRARDLSYLFLTCCRHEHVLED